MPSLTPSHQSASLRGPEGLPKWPAGCTAPGDACASTSLDAPAPSSLEPPVLFAPKPPSTSPPGPVLNLRDDTVRNALQGMDGEDPNLSPMLRRALRERAGGGGSPPSPEGLSPPRRNRRGLGGPSTPPTDERTPVTPPPPPPPTEPPSTGRRTTGRTPYASSPSEVKFSELV